MCTRVVSLYGSEVFYTVEWNSNDWRVATVHKAAVRPPALKKRQAAVLQNITFIY